MSDFEGGFLYCFGWALKLQGLNLMVTENLY